MKKIIIALSIVLSFALPTYAFADQAACEAKAVSKDGKPLYGAAKDASIKKCMGRRRGHTGCLYSPAQT